MGCQISKNLRRIWETDELSGSIKNIKKEHDSRHTSQVPLILEYLKSSGLKQADLSSIEEILALEQRIFWTIDDTVDQSYRFQKDERALEYHNEVVKYVSFMELMSAIIEKQLSSKSEFLVSLLGKKLMAERFLDSLTGNLVPLVRIPHNEAILRNKIILEKNPSKISKMLIENQLNRSQNVKVYISSAESITGIEIPKDPFLFFRSLQLVREDIEDVAHDKKRGTSNLINILHEKHHSSREIKEQLLKVLNILDEKLSSFADEDFFYFRKHIDYEKGQIEKLLEGFA